MEGGGFQGYMFSSLLISRKIQNLFCLLLFDIATCNCTDVKFILIKFYFAVVEAFPKYLPVAYSTFGCMCMEDCSVPSLCTIHHSTCSLHILSEVRVFLYKYSFSQHLDLEKHEKP